MHDTSHSRAFRGGGCGSGEFTCPVIPRAARLFASSAAATNSLCVCSANKEMTGRWISRVSHPFGAVVGSGGYPVRYPIYIPVPRRVITAVHPAVHEPCDGPEWR